MVAIVETENGYDIICTEGEGKNYAPSICDSIFEFDSATECNERTVYHYWEV